jgi:hypothetical protein
MHLLCVLGLHRQRTYAWPTGAKCEAAMPPQPVSGQSCRTVPRRRHAPATGIWSVMPNCPTPPYLRSRYLVSYVELSHAAIPPQPVSGQLCRTVPRRHASAAGIWSVVPNCPTPPPCARNRYARGLAGTGMKAQRALRRCRLRMYQGVPAAGHSGCSARRYSRRFRRYIRILLYYSTKCIFCVCKKLWYTGTCNMKYGETIR